MVNLSKNDKLIGLLYWNECYHCKLLLPEWNKVKQDIKDNNNVYKIIEIENGEIQKLDEFNEINKNVLNGSKIIYVGFPTIFKIVNENIQYYENGDRTKEAILKWLYDNNTAQMTGGYKRKMKKTNKNGKKLSASDDVNSITGFWG